MKERSIFLGHVEEVWVFSRVSGGAGWGGLGNEGFLIRRRRRDRCPRSRGRGGCRRECGRRWVGIFRLPGLAGCGYQYTYMYVCLCAYTFMYMHV